MGYKGAPRELLLEELKESGETLKDMEKYREKTFVKFHCIRIGVMVLYTYSNGILYGTGGGFPTFYFEVESLLYEAHYYCRDYESRGI
jgi:hypothetical protein